MSPDSKPRQLQAVVNARGAIVSWKCTACNWTKMAEHPEQVSTNTEVAFSRHRCEEHPKGRGALRRPALERRMARPPALDACRLMFFRNPLRCP